MTGLLIKLILCPVGVYVSSFIFPEVYYSSIYQPLIVGLVLAGSSQIMELLLLRKGTLWVSTLVDLVVSIIIVYFVSLALPGSRVSIMGATTTAILLALIEYFLHYMVVTNVKAKKS